MYNIDIMEVYLVAIIITQFIYAIFRDISATKEREKLQLKLMSSTPQEYINAITPQEENAKDSVSVGEYVDAYEGLLTSETILKAEDRT